MARTVDVVQGEMAAMFLRHEGFLGAGAPASRCPYLCLLLPVRFYTLICVTAPQSELCCVPGGGSVLPVQWEPS